VTISSLATPGIQNHLPTAAFQCEMTYGIGAKVLIGDSDSQPAAQEPAEVTDAFGGVLKLASNAQECTRSFSAIILLQANDLALRCGQVA
jgi:hypothetical protein